MSPTDDHKIGPTAHYTAYTWHHLGLPHAHLFRTRLGASLFWAVRLTAEAPTRLLPGVPTMTQYLELRHRLFESALEEAAPDVAIELGAGLSRRGVTWASRGLRYVEVDLPHMVEAKRRLIAERSDRALREAIAGRLTHAAVDVLADDFDEHLRRWVGDARRPLVMAEGVLSYFAQPQRRKLVASVARALEGTEGRFVSECRIQKTRGAMGVASRLLGRSIRLATSGRGARTDLPSHEAVRQTFLDAGFADVEPLDPRRVPHLPRFADLPARVWVGSRALARGAPMA